MSSTALPLRLPPTTAPPLRVLEGGRAPSRLARRAAYRRRRLVVVIVAVALLATTVLLASAAVARIAGGAPSAAGGPSPTPAAASGAAGVAAPAAVVVQPGDSLWSIAAEVAPDVDVRITVDRLVALNGRAPIVVGQQLELPTA